MKLAFTYQKQARALLDRTWRLNVFVSSFDQRLKKMSLQPPIVYLVIRGARWLTKRVFSTHLFCASTFLPCFFNPRCQYWHSRRDQIHMPLKNSGNDQRILWSHLFSGRMDLERQKFDNLIGIHSCWLPRQTILLHPVLLVLPKSPANRSFWFLLMVPNWAFVLLLQKFSETQYSTNYDL